MFESMLSVCIASSPVGRRLISRRNGAVYMAGDPFCLFDQPRMKSLPEVCGFSVETSEEFARPARRATFKSRRSPAAYPVPFRRALHWL